MKRLTVCLLLSALTSGLVWVAPPAPALPNDARVQTYKGGLNFPVDMAWVPGTTRIFFTEKNTGKIRVIVDRDLRAKACVTLDVDDTGEGGALGIVLHPNFDENHYLYVYWTKRSPLQNRVTRFTVRDNECRNRRHILSGIRANGQYHHGGQLEFVNGKLFVSVGESHEAGEAQKKGNRLGKILRVNPNGSVPDGNPFGSNNPVWTYGHRNPFGLAHNPATDKIYSSENGPECDDELNLISKGRNYGWGNSYQCGTAGVGVNPKPPIRRWSSTPVPTDPWWYKGRYGALSGSLYLGMYETGQLYRFFFNDRGTDIRKQRVAHRDDAGILDVSKGPGGWLYYLTPSALKRIVKG